MTEQHAAYIVDIGTVEDVYSEESMVARDELAKAVLPGLLWRSGITDEWSWTINESVSDVAIRRVTDMAYRIADIAMESRSRLYRGTEDGDSEAAGEIGINEVDTVQDLFLITSAQIGDLWTVKDPSPFQVVLKSSGWHIVDWDGQDYKAAPHPIAPLATTPSPNLTRQNWRDVDSFGTTTPTSPERDWRTP